MTEDAPPDAADPVHGVSAYIHIPFCVRRCPYCAFYSVAIGQAKRGEVSPLAPAPGETGSGAAPFSWGAPPPKPPGILERYIDALEREFTARLPSGSARARTLYIGGGTPTLLPAPLLTRLVRLVTQTLAGPETREFTVEALPGTLTPEKAEILASAGVGRVTLGLQSTERAVLEGVGRAREYDALPRALEYLRQAGIRNIGVDLIIGLPGETREGFRRGLEYLLGLECTHISAYMLFIEEGTPFADARRRGETREAPDWKVRRNYTAFCSALRRAGYEHYEVSNFALPGYACRHNLATWRYESLLGFGAASVGTSWRGGELVRRHTAASLQAYCDHPERAYTEEILTAGDIFRERLLLGLRTSEGLPDDDAFAAGCGFLPAALREKLEGFTRSGHLAHTDGRYRATLKGMLWLDAILVELF